MWASVIGLSIFTQNVAVGMDEDRGLPKNYLAAVKNIEILYENFQTPEDLKTIRETAKAALALRPEGQEDPYVQMLEYCTRFGTGTSRNDFLKFLEKFDTLLSNASSAEQTIESALVAGLILMPQKVRKDDFECLMSLLEGSEEEQTCFQAFFKGFKIPKNIRRAFKW